MSPASAFADWHPIPWSALPGELIRIGAEWHDAVLRVAARQDDADEWRIVRLLPGEKPWVGWREVEFPKVKR